MEWDLRRTQSLRNIPSSGDKPTWTDAGLRDKTKSVSQLVARYQTTVEKTTGSQLTPRETTEGKTTKPLNEVQMTSPPLKTTGTHLESLMKRNEERERSRVAPNLTRSKSTGSLQNSTGSIEALKAVFESNNSAKRVKSSFRSANETLSYTADTPVMNGETEDVQRAAREQKPPAETKKEAKEDHVTQKMVNLTQADSRKTIAGIDFEKMAASEADEKKRSIADFRDSSFSQTKEILSVSVKVMSALYMSKVANQDSTNSPPKMERDQSCDSGKKVKPTKIKEDSQQKMDDLPPFPPDRHETEAEESQQLKPSQLSKHMLHQQRQKSELKRLLKHTHPELRMLDDVVDEEFAEVLSSEKATVGETGYEGEVLSRCLIFENRDSSANVPPYTKIHMAHEAEERCNCSKTSTVSERPKEEPHSERVKENIDHNDSLDLRPDFNEQVEEQMLRVDVQATRRIFESQSKIQKPSMQSEISGKENLHKDSKNKNTDLGEWPQEPCDHVGTKRTQQDCSGKDELLSDETTFEDNAMSFPNSESHSEKIKTSTALFQNNPFISTNIEKENSYMHTSKDQNVNLTAGEDYLTANVKNRTHLFESMPFDKIRHQNRDEIETMVENIKETLNFLFQVKVIQSAGAIIEVNETMIAKKAKFTLSDHGPEINYNEVAEGGAQNFIVQLLPRVNLKPQITYLKEDNRGSMETTVVDVLVHQHQFNPNKDTEFKTANVVQLIEDILNQDNSLRKGVIIQEDAAVLVYSLYKYVDEDDVKNYSPPKLTEYNESDTGTGHMSNTNNKETPTKMSPEETTKDQPCSESIRPNVKVSVKLFKRCIEKGDLEYLKNLQDDEPTVEKEELPQNQTAAAVQNGESNQEQVEDLAGEGISEYTPVDVKRLKSIFSEDKSQIQGKCNQSANISNASRKRQSSTKCKIQTLCHQQTKNTFRECGGQDHKEDVPQDDCRVHQAELADVVDDADEICDLQTAIQNLQQAAKEAKSFHQSLEETQKICTKEKTDNIVKISKQDAGLFQERMDTSFESGIEMCWNETPSGGTLGQESDQKHQNTVTCCKHNDPEKVQTAGTCRTELDEKQSTQTPQSSEKTPEPEEEEVVFQGKIQAALDSLEKSNINVTRGDFRAAMIYRNASKSHQTMSQNDKKPTTKEFCPEAQCESAQLQPKQEVTEIIHEPTTGAVSEKRKRPTGPKPPLPPKPEHLKVKQEDNLPTATINPETTNICTVTTTEPASQIPQSSTIQNKQHLFKSTNESMVGIQSSEFLDEDKQILQETEMRNQFQVTLERVETENNTLSGQQTNTVKENFPQNDPGKDNMNVTDENHIDFHEACQKFESKKAVTVKIAPVKPKRQKGAKFNDKNPKNLPGGITRDPSVLADPSTTTCGITAEREDKSEKVTKPEGKVEMREKKGRPETEVEQRQRLSVHMDEIMRGNNMAAKEIFNNLRKQEQLQSILSRVEEIEQDTSGVDVRSLRKVFENVPDWVVGSGKKKPKKIRPESNDKPAPLPTNKTESKSSMEHVYGDLERASEEIINLKEQTLARLKDIEDAIRKALYSVSTLKSDSDIAGLSCLFKESLGTLKGPSCSADTSKISIGSSSMKSQEAQEIIPPRNTTTQSMQCTTATKQQQSPPSSPAFISIRSAARKTDKTEAVPPETSTCMKCQQSPKPEERFRTTKTLKCSSPAQSNRRDPRKRGRKQTNSPQNTNREVSVLEVQTDGEGKSITKTVSENYERTDNSGKKVYTSKTSAVISAQPETTSQAISPSAYQVSVHPDV